MTPAEVCEEGDKMQLPDIYVGKVVHFIDEDSKKSHRAAIISYIHPSDMDLDVSDFGDDERTIMKGPGIVNLAVFDELGHSVSRPYICYDPSESTTRSWHFNTHK